MFTLGVWGNLGIDLPEGWIAESPSRIGYRPDDQALFDPVVRSILFEE